MQRLKRTAVLLALPLLGFGVAGCNFQEHYGHCPTDARAITMSCAGQEAVRKCPCGPDAAYYGHRPTTWTSWPGGWEQYECEQCVVTTEASTPRATAPTVVTEPTVAEMPSPPSAPSTSLEELKSDPPTAEESVPIEPIDSIAPDEVPAPPEEVAPIAPRDRYEIPVEPDRPAIPAPKLPEMPTLPAIPDAPQTDGVPPLNNAVELLDLPDPSNPGPSEALPWEVAAEDNAEAQAAKPKKRIPTYADLFKP